jgi:hypothetical protein
LNGWTERAAVAYLLARAVCGNSAQTSTIAKQTKATERRADARIRAEYKGDKNIFMVWCYSIGDRFSKTIIKTKSTPDYLPHVTRENTLRLKA